MRALLYCYKSGLINNVLGLALAGVVTRPFTSPPLDAESFPYARLANADLIYIALHGMPGKGVLWGDEMLPALDVHGVSGGPDMRPGAVVILEGCYGAKTPFPQAFKERGAAAVFASRDETFDKRFTLGKAGTAGNLMVRRLRAGMAIERVVDGIDTFELVG